MTETETTYETPADASEAPPPEGPQPGEAESPAEAEPNEAETDEEAADAELAEAPQPEAQGTTPEEWEARFKKADRSFKTYSRNVEEAWSEDALGLVAFTASPSAPPGYLHMQDAGRIDPDVKAMLMEWLGLARERDYKRDPYTATCEACDGEGRTATGSQVPDFKARQCTDCGGRGFTDTRANGSAQAGTLVIAGTETHTPLDDMPQGDVDNWGEPAVLPDGRLNPNFGKQPQFKQLVEPWGITAGLTAQDVATPAG